MEMLSRSSSEVMELSVALNGRDEKTALLARDTCRKECVNQVPTYGTAREDNLPHGEDHSGQAKLRGCKCQLVSN